MRKDYLREMNSREYQINAIAIRESIIDMENILGIRRDMFNRYGRKIADNDFRKQDYLGAYLARVYAMMEIYDEHDEEEDDVGLFSIMNAMESIV